MAKPAAFLPSPAARETSVSRHGSEPAERLWILGRLAAGERNLHGVAIFDAKVKRTANLDILAAEPPEYHAAIRGWFWNPEDLALQKARQLSAAQVLASHATLWRSPEGAVAT